MQERLTIQDIARLAGVSKATVSRVLNQKPDVKPATRERILRIVDEHDFVPSITASGLAGGRPHMIGVLAPALTWPFIPEIVQGVAERVEQSSHELTLYTTAHEQGHSLLLERILDTRLVAGLLAVTPGPFSQNLIHLYEQGVPVVLIDDQHLPPNAPWVWVDNRQGAYEAVRYLLDLGHRKIAHIKGPGAYQCSIDRYQGYKQALIEAGITPRPELVMQGDFLVASGRSAANTLFAGPERPSAIFAANDHMAWGVLEAAEAWGLRVPEELSVIGFDDMAPSAHKRPPLTTVSQPFHEIGRRAAELLLWQIDARRAAPVSGWPENKTPFPSLSSPITNEPLHIQLATSLVVRESCSQYQVAKSTDQQTSPAIAL